MNTIPYRLPNVWREAALLPSAVERSGERLRGSEVYLWQVDLSAIDTGAALTCLPEGERRRDSAWTYRKDHELWLRCRAALRTLIGRHIGERPRDVRIAAAAGGKPRLAHDFPDLHFSVARAATRALIALARVPIGIDLAPVRRDFSWRVVADHWFHPREQEALSAAAPADQPGLFFQIWTHKEAVAKAVGAGFDRQSMASFAVPPEGGVTHRPEKSWQLWHLTPLAVAPGYRASLAGPEVSPVALAWEEVSLAEGGADAPAESGKVSPLS